MYTVYDTHCRRSGAYSELRSCAFATGQRRDAQWVSSALGDSEDRLRERPYVEQNNSPQDDLEDLLDIQHSIPYLRDSTYPSDTRKASSCSKVCWK